jgi:hypothetical protein
MNSIINYLHGIYVNFYQSGDMIRYHITEKEVSIAEIMPGSEMINSTEDILEIMADAGYNGSTGLIVYADNLNKDFFDLKTKIAGDMLQKFSNYRMKLAIIGDFSEVKSKSLRDFIRESNTLGVINFTGSLAEAIDKLGR